MTDPSSASEGAMKFNLSSLVSQYSKLQQKVIAEINTLASNMSSADPGQFLIAQFGMSQVNQIGQSISNMIYQVNSVCMQAVRNQKAGG